jgi:HlyD family secretion protein
MKRGRSVSLLLLLCVAGVGGGGYWWWRSRKATTPAVQNQIVTAKRGNLVVTVSATGVVEPEFTVEIKSKASGTVASVKVVPGVQVEQKALLIEIDPIIERRKVIQAQADLTMAQAQRASLNSKLEYALAQLARDEALLKKGLVARETVDTERKDLAVLRGDLQVSAAQMLGKRNAYEEAKDRLSETKIYAPISGTILDRTVNPGQVITAGTTQGGGQTLLTLANLGRLFVKVKVDEADITKVLADQQVRVTSDALPGLFFAGKVLRVAPQGKVESSVTVFEVVVEVDAEGVKRLRPALTANVEIRVGEVKNALLVPRRAAQQQDGKTVVVLEGGSAQPVEIGLADDRQIEIKSGIAEGARVVVPGLARAKTDKTSSTLPPGMGGMGGGVGRGMGGGGGGGGRR